MTVLRNNFDGGPDGTTISVGNSGQYGNDPFDTVVSSGTGTVLKYASTENLARPTAEFAMRLATATANTLVSVQWTTSMGAQTQIWTRFYVRFSAVVPNTSNDSLLFSAHSLPSYAGVSVWLRTVTTPYALQLYNNLGGTASYMPSYTPVANEWIRVEMRASFGAGATGSSELYYYGGDDVDGPDYTDTIAQTSQDYGGSASVFGLGQSAGTQFNTPNTYFSGWELNNTGFPGPAPFRPGKGVPGILTNPVAIHTDVT